MEKIQLIPEWRLIPFVERKPNFVHVVWSMDPGLLPFAQLSFTSYFSLMMDTIPRSESVILMPAKGFEHVKPIILGTPSRPLFSTLYSMEKEGNRLCFSVLVPHYANFHQRALRAQKLEGAWGVERYYNEVQKIVTGALALYNSGACRAGNEGSQLDIFRAAGHRVNTFSVCGGLDPDFAAKLVMMSHNQNGSS